MKRLLPLVLALLGGFPLMGQPSAAFAAPSLEFPWPAGEYHRITEGPRPEVTEALPPLPTRRT